MKIAHILDTLVVGGAERVVLTLSALQLKQGHSVEVHYLYAGGPLEAEFAELGIPIHAANASSSVKMIARLYRNLVASKPDVVHLHNATAGAYGTVAAVLARVPVRVSTRHGLTAPRGAWRREAKFWLAARFCQRTVAVSSQTERNMRAFRFSIPAKISLVVNGSLPARTSATESAPASGHFTFVHVARLNPVKDQTTLLEAFCGALKTTPELRLIIIGDGPLREQLEQLTAKLNITKHVLFAGEREHVGNWLAVSDCFVLSSFTEGTPISLLEALAAGLPCIVTDVGEMPVIVNQSRCGLVVTPGSATELTTAMLQMATMRLKERAILGHNARLEYEARFQPETMAARYIEIYQQALVPRTSRSPLHSG